MEFETFATFLALVLGIGATVYIAIDLGNKYEELEKRARIKELIKAADLLESQTEIYLETLKQFSDKTSAMNSSIFTQLEDFAYTRKALDKADKATETAQSMTKAALKLYAARANARLQDTGLQAYLTSGNNNNQGNNNQGNNKGNDNRGNDNRGNNNQGNNKGNKSNNQPASTGYNQQQFEGIAKGNGFGSKEKLAELLKAKGKTEADFLAMEREERKAFLDQLKQSL